MQNDMVTIVVPIYKIKEEYLRNCIKSIMEQTSDNWKLILVDDGSPDNCGKICDEYSDDKKIKVIHQENQGVSVARNVGIDATDTEWVTFVDPDDWIDNSEIEEVLSAAKKYAPDIIAVGYAREFSDHSIEEHLMEKSGMVSNEIVKCMRLAPLHRYIVNGKILPYSVNAIWNKVYRTEYLRKYNMHFEPAARKGQDRIFNLYALDKTDKIYYIRKCMYHYRNDNETSIVNRYNPNTVKNAEITFVIMRKWIAENNKPDRYNRLLDCRISIRFYEYMHLYFYNAENPADRKSVNKELKALLKKDLYVSALKNADKSIFSFTEKVFVAFLKMHMLGMCRLLIKLRDAS